MEFNPEHNSQKDDEVTTELGHNLTNSVMRLRPAIRKGDEHEAFFWALQIEEISPQILWDSLEVYTSFEIGPVDSEISTTIHVLRAQYENALGRKAYYASSYILANAILQLCRSEKTMEVLELVNEILPKTLLDKEITSERSENYEE